MKRACWLLSLCLAVPAAFAGTTDSDPDDDPEAGASFLLGSAAQRVGDRIVIGGTLRSTDDFGATHDRDFRLRVSGIPGRDRQVLLNRYEPACLPLARAAGMTAERFCDRIRLEDTADGKALSFFSYDANHAYVFHLVERAPGTWQHVPRAPVPQPALTLELADTAEGTTVRWRLVAGRQHYTQAARFTTEWLRRHDLDGMDAAVLPLGEVLSSFTRYEFERADLGRDHPEYAPSPYGLWDEQPVEGGCIGFLCFGNVGGTGGGGGADDNGRCEPGHGNYTPDQCPHDLTHATWPISKRVKVWKVNDDRFGFSWFIENKGTGPFQYGAYVIGAFDMPTFAWATLVPKSGGQPIMSWASVASFTNPYGGDCFRELRYELPLAGGNQFPFLNVGMQPGQAVAFLRPTVSCRKSSGRPKGKFRLFVQTDPSQTFDSPGYLMNNTGNSGLLDWIHLKE